MTAQTHTAWQEVPNSYGLTLRHSTLGYVIRRNCAVVGLFMPADASGALHGGLLGWHKNFAEAQAMVAAMHPCAS